MDLQNTKVRVETEVLALRADDAGQKAGRMETRLGEIRRIVGATRRCWAGEAGDACRQKYETRSQEADELMRRLKRQPRTLLSIAEVYGEAEAEAKNTAGPLPGNVLG